jgi:hypothetical protein
MELTSRLAAIKDQRARTDHAIAAGRVQVPLVAPALT